MKKSTSADSAALANSTSSLQKSKSRKKAKQPKSSAAVTADIDTPAVGLDAVSVVQRRISHEEYEDMRLSAGDDRQPYRYLLSSLKDPSNRIFIAEVGVECIGIFIYRLEHAKIRQGIKHQDATAVLLWVKPTYRRRGLTTLFMCTLS